MAHAFKNASNLAELPPSKCDGYMVTSLQKKRDENATNPTKIQKKLTQNTQKNEQASPERAKKREKCTFCKRIICKINLIMSKKNQKINKKKQKNRVKYKKNRVSIWGRKKTG